MSSLTQHHGGRSPDGRRVELLVYLVRKGPRWEEYNGPGGPQGPRPQSTGWCDDAEPVTLTRPDGSSATVAKLYRIFRRPAGMLGCWVLFRINGSVEVPDLSVPLALHRLPRDARPLSAEEASRYWFTP